MGTQQKLDRRNQFLSESQTSQKVRILEIIILMDLTLS